MSRRIMRLVAAFAVLLTIGDTTASLLEQSFIGRSSKLTLPAVIRLRGGTSTGSRLPEINAAQHAFQSQDDNLQNALKHIDEVLGRNHIKLGADRPNKVGEAAAPPPVDSLDAEVAAMLETRPKEIEMRPAETYNFPTGMHSSPVTSSQEASLESRPDDTGDVSESAAEDKTSPEGESEAQDTQRPAAPPVEEAKLATRPEEEASSRAEQSQAEADAELEAKFSSLREAFSEISARSQKVAAVRSQLSQVLKTQQAQLHAQPPEETLDVQPRAQPKPQPMPVQTRVAEWREREPAPAAPPAPKGVPFGTKLARTQSISHLENFIQSLEGHVSTLTQSYTQLAECYGCEQSKPAWPTRTESYSVLDRALLTNPLHHEEEEEEEEELQATRPVPVAEAEEDEEVQEEARLWREVEEQVEGQATKIDRSLPPEERLSVIIVSSEITPFSKSGGLADVCDKLGMALSSMGHRVMTVAPLYSRNYENVHSTNTRRHFGLFGQKLEVEYHHTFTQTVPASNGERARGVDHVFVGQGCFERHGMYGHNDDLMRFALLAWAALEAPFAVECDGSVYGDDVVFLINDWMVGLVPLIMASHYRRYGCYTKARTVFDIHNMGYCGNFPVVQATDLGLPDDAYFDLLFHDKQIKLLKGGIELADRVVTVSPSYRDEVLTPEGGFGLHERCANRLQHLDGVLNGIDLNDWNPATDPYLSKKFQGFDNFYSAADLTGKKSCKLHLQSCFHLPEDPDVPIICFIGRLAYQKGLDILESVMPWLMAEDHSGVTGKVQIILMGTGEQKYADFLNTARGQYHGRVGVHVGFTPELEHKILAGADILLMPSRYEPCGLPQLYAQRYGTVPVVHGTGGLKDSVVQYDPFQNAGTGWKFDKADEDGLKYGLWNALNTYKHHKDAWQGLIQRCMAADFSWERSAQRYVEIFKWAKIDEPYISPIPF